MMRPVAALCVAKKNHYRDLPNVEVFDEQRDALTFTGGMPIVAHPPCRGWSAFCSHQAKVCQGELDLGLFCAEKLREEGGGIGTAGVFETLCRGESSGTGIIGRRLLVNLRLAILVGVSDAKSNLALFFENSSIRCAGAVCVKTGEERP